MTGGRAWRAAPTQDAPAQDSEPSLRRRLFYLEFDCDRYREDAGFSWAADCGRGSGVDAGRPDKSSDWKIARGHGLSREEHDVLFSAGYVDFGECGVVSGAVFDWQDATLIGEAPGRLNFFYFFYLLFLLAAGFSSWGGVVFWIEDHASAQAFAVAFGVKVLLVAEGEVDDAALAG